MFDRGSNVKKSNWFPVLAAELRFSGIPGNQLCMNPVSVFYRLWFTMNWKCLGNNFLNRFSWSRAFKQKAKTITALTSIHIIRFLKRYLTILENRKMIQ